MTQIEPVGNKCMVYTVCTVLPQYTCTCNFIEIKVCVQVHIYEYSGLLLAKPVIINIILHQLPSSVRPQPSCTSFTTEALLRIWDISRSQKPLGMKASWDVHVALTTMVAKTPGNSKKGMAKFTYIANELKKQWKMMTNRKHTWTRPWPLHVQLNSN